MNPEKGTRKEFALGAHRWSERSLARAEHAYLAYINHGDKNLYNRAINRDFFNPLQTTILAVLNENAKEKTSSLVTTVYDNGLTLLEIISEALCIYHVQHKKEKNEPGILIKESDLETFGMDAGDFLMSLNDLSKSLNDFIYIRILDGNEGVSTFPLVLTVCLTKL